MERRWDAKITLYILAIFLLIFIDATLIEFCIAALKITVFAYVPYIAYSLLTAMKKNGISISNYYKA